MMNRRIHKPGRPGGGSVAVSGFTLIEAVMSMLVVGLMLVAALNTVGAARISQSRNTENIQGPLLAQDLMTEILSQAYQEPVDTVAFGREDAESDASRDAWDDIDDYAGWSASPPQTQDGTVMPDLNGWGREVTVTWANALSPDTTSATATDLKRIDVTVTFNGRPVVTLSALRSFAWDASNATGGSGVSAAIGNSGEAALASLLESLFK